MTTADGPISPEMDGFSARRQVEWSIAELAREQHGVVSLEQLEGMGIGEVAAQQRVDACRWHRVHWGVYLVGHARLSREGRYLAAVLACGQGAVLSHCSAADLWGIRQDRRPSIDVTAPSRRGRTPPGID